MRRTCERLIDEAGITPGGDIMAICEQVSRRRGRAIRLTSMELEDPSLHGLWIAVPETDIIVYQADTSRSHQEHIIAHELSHIICGHDGEAAPATTPRATAAPATAAPVAAAPKRVTVPEHLFPDLDPNLVRRSLMRSVYSDRDEQEAEMMASLILAGARQDVTGAPPALAPEIASVMARVESVIGRG
ncbi:ImmA/IrrE family metallo-endopeptidase [Streptomyces sp. NPDC045431]|uniref:ImmA/IrrE family metallo-endopeptidase n=1 Tax=Streptomyces sp. NPDC045431 TaxID=3155613 RepID=UPI003402676D